MKVGASTSSFGDADPGPIHLLEDLGLEVELNPFGRRLSRGEAKDFIADLDGLIAGLEPLDRDVLSSASNLKAVARVGIGMDNVDREAAEDLDIRVSNTPEPPTVAVAEMTVAAALSLMRGLHGHFRNMRERTWKKRVGSSLSGATVHIIGFGRIGRKVADLLRPFGARIQVTDPMLSADDDLDGASLVSLEEGLGGADVVTLHAGTDEVVLGAEELEHMKEGAFLLNSARGEQVDESALFNLLEQGELGGVWFDAFWDEPYDGPLLDQDRFFATPHVSTYTTRCRRRMELEAVRNLARDLGLKGAD